MGLRLFFSYNNYNNIYYLIREGFNIYYTTNKIQQRLSLFHHYLINKEEVSEGAAEDLVADIAEYSSPFNVLIYLYVNRASHHPHLAAIHGDGQSKIETSLQP